MLSETMDRFIELAHENKKAGLNTDINEQKKYAVISTPRCGSKMLCDLLARNELGWPSEWFNMRYIQQYLNKKNMNTLDMKVYLDDLITATASPNTKILGVNFHIDQYQAFLNKKIDLLNLGFDAVYYIKRRDIVRQAYSFAKAMNSELWSKDMEKRAGFTTTPEITITPEDFLRALNKIYNDRLYFENKIKTKTDRIFIYEDIIQDGLHTCITRIRQDLDLPDTETVYANPGLKKQSGHFDESQLETILAELGLEERTGEDTTSAETRERQTS